MDFVFVLNQMGGFKACRNAQTIFELTPMSDLGISSTHSEVPRMTPAMEETCNVLR